MEAGFSVGCRESEGRQGSLLQDPTSPCSMTLRVTSPNPAPGYDHERPLCPALEKAQELQGFHDVPTSAGAPFKVLFVYFSNYKECRSKKTGKRQSFLTPGSQ